MGIQPKKLKLELTGQDASSDGNADVWLLDESDRDVILEPHASDVFVFELKSNIGAGYLWSLADVQSEGFNVEPVRNDVFQKPVAQHFGTNPPIGADGALRFVVSRPKSKQITFSARTSFAMIEHRPWLSPDSGDSRCQFSAEYEKLTAGVDRAEQLRRLEEAKAANA